MKVITWNCNMAFRKKADVILQHKPDILVVPECESLEKLVFDVDTPRPTDMLWFGNNQNKDLQLIIPIEVTNAELKLKLYAIWANNPNDPDGQYVEQVWKAIHHYDK